MRGYLLNLYILWVVCGMQHSAYAAPPKPFQDFAILHPKMYTAAAPLRWTGRGVKYCGKKVDAGLVKTSHALERYQGITNFGAQGIGALSNFYLMRNTSGLRNLQ